MVTSNTQSWINSFVDKAIQVGLYNGPSYGHKDGQTKKQIVKGVESAFVDAQRQGAGLSDKMISDLEQVVQEQLQKGIKEGYYICAGTDEQALYALTESRRKALTPYNGNNQ
jgi:hypothetical protein